MNPAAATLTAATDGAGASSEQEAGYDWASAMTLVPAGVVVQDASGVIQAANPAAAEILGISEDQLRGQTSVDRDPWCVRSDGSRFPGEEHPAMVTLRTGEPQDGVTMGVYQPDGALRWILIDTRPLVSDGAIKGVVAHFSDITGTRAEESARRRASARFRAAFEHVPIGMQLLSLAEGSVGRVLQVNDRFCQMVGRRPEEVEGASILDLTHAADRERDLAALRAAADGNDREYAGQDKRYHQPDGAVTYAKAHGGVVRDEHGKPLYAVVGVEDVTDRRRAEAHAVERERWFQSVFDAAVDAILVADDERQFVAANPSACAMLGLTQEEILSRRVEDFMSPVDQEQVEPMWQAFLDAGWQDAEYELHRDDGRVVDVDYRARANFVAGRHLTFMRDVSARKRAERALQRSEQRYRQIVETAEEGVLTLDAEERTSFVNRSLAKELGYEPDELIGRAAALLVPNSELAELERVRETLAKGETIRTELSLSRRDGGIMSAAIVASALRGDQGQLAGALWMVTDLTAWRETQARLGETRTFLEAITQHMAEGLVAINAKGVVTYANGAAEEMLGWPAKQLIGGELHAAVHRFERTLCSPGDCALLQAPTEAGPIRVESEIFLRGNGSELPVSFSSAPLVVGDKSYGAVIVFTDISERKQREEQTQRELEALGWIERIREAIAENRLVLYGQPIIDLGGGNEVQTELLLRMRERDGDIVAPGLFLPVAERYGLMKEIDLWVIREAIAFAADGGRYEINLSGPSIGEAEVLETIERELQNAGVDPSRLVFEITETALMEDIDGGRAFAEQLSRIGCRFALDDFGTGYGSFTYLKHLPVDVLKIDTEFVRDLVHGSADAHVVKAIVNLAADFGQTTVAEGVEDEQTLERLRALGVNQAQGFHIGRPKEINRPHLSQASLEETS